MAEDRDTARPERGRERALLLLALLLALLTRLGTAPEVLPGDRVLVDGPDGYYHLRRAALIEAHWPYAPQRDSFLGAPEGGLIQWPPLFDLLLATLARAVPGEPRAALEAVGVRLPVVLGLLQVLLVGAVARRLAGPRAGAVAALLAAILPAAVRYALLGALDHDPAIEVLSLLVLFSLAGAVKGDAPDTGPGLAPSGESRGGLGRIGTVLALALPLAALPLTWAGSVIHIGLFAFLLVTLRLVAGAGPAARWSARLAPAALLASVLVAPFAARSVWSDAGSGAFAGLSWLHVAALAGLAALSGAWVWGSRPASEAASDRRWALASGAAGALFLLALAPRVIPALWAGVRFLGREEAFVTDVAESRPLLSLFGGFDPRPFLVRLSALPLLLPFLAWRRFRRPDPGLLFALAVAAGTLALALLQARYSHAAALSLAVLAGVAWERARSVRTAWKLGIFSLALFPCLAAYVSLPGLGGQRFYGRSNDLVTSGMAEAAAYLRAAAPPDPAEGDPALPARESVLAPWAYGHWIHWLGGRATVANPFGPQGQTAFAEGVRFWLLDDPGEAEALLRRHRVRWVVATTEGYPVTAYARMAKIDPRRWLDARGEVEPQRYLATMGARLAWAGPEALPTASGLLPPLPFLREVYRTQGLRQLPDGTLAPLLRIYEVVAEPSSV